MRFMLFSKCSKFNVDLKNLEKQIEKVFSLDTCIWICCVKLSQLRREHLPSAVNELTNSPEILYITKKDFFLLKFFRIDQQIS